jgi:hypothetical protein
MVVFPVIFYVGHIRYIEFHVRMVVNNKMRNMWWDRVMTFNVLAYLRSGEKEEITSFISADFQYQMPFKFI